MIGNDIVDLKLAALENNWRRKGWLEKVFNAGEINLIQQTEQQDKMVWLLWSIKESVYKIVNRKNGIVEFSPKKITIERLAQKRDSYIATVHYNKVYCFCRSIATDDFVYTTAISDLKTSYLELPDDIVVEKSGKLPFYGNVPASVTHHGRFRKVIVMN